MVAAPEDAPLRTALIVATRMGDATPADRVAGLSLLARTTLTLQKHGFAKVLVLRQDAPGEGAARCESVADVTDGLPERFLVTTPYQLVHPSYYEALAAELDGAAADQGRASGVLAVSPAGLAGPVLVDRSAISSCSNVGEVIEGLQRHSTESATHVGDPALWRADASTEEGRRQTVHHLFEACRKPVDGLISRHLNRHVSIFVSKRIVNTRVTPNQLTMIALAIAVIGAGVVSMATYWTMLLGALLFQLSSILDGCDGELARVRFEQSPFGAWFDTVADDLCNLMLYASTAYAANSLPGGEPYALAGLIAVIAGALTMGLYYAELMRLGSGDFYAMSWSFEDKSKGAMDVLLEFIKLLLKRDLFIFLFVVAALFGVMHWMTPLMMVGTLVTLGAGTVRTVQWARARSPQG